MTQFILRHVHELFHSIFKTAKHARWYDVSEIIMSLILIMDCCYKTGQKNIRNQKENHVLEFACFFLLYYVL